MKKKIVWAVVLVGLCVGAYFLYYGYSEFNRVPETAADKETDMKVEAEALMDEFIKDQASAEKKYGKKTIEITGTIVAIEINGSDDISISLKTNATDDIGIPLSVKVMLTPDMETKVKSLKQGDKITLKGLYTGMNTDIEFNRGIII